MSACLPQAVSTERKISVIRTVGDVDIGGWTGYGWDGKGRYVDWDSLKNWSS